MRACAEHGLFAQSDSHADRESGQHRVTVGAGGQPHRDSDADGFGHAPSLPISDGFGSALGLTHAAGQRLTYSDGQRLGDRDADSHAHRRGDADALTHP